jgi:hypothetical protein
MKMHVSYRSSCTYSGQKKEGRVHDDMWSLCLRPLLATAGSGAASGGRTVIDSQKATWQKVRSLQPYNARQCFAVRRELSALLPFILYNACIISAYKKENIFFSTSHVLQCPHAFDKNYSDFEEGSLPVSTMRLGNASV